MAELEGQLRATEAARFAIVVSRYNESITGKLLAGAREALQQAGVSADRIDVAWVPGAWELPLVARKWADRGDHAAILCLGAVIRGETTHDQYINHQVSHSLGQLAMECRIPVLFGVLTCQTLEQAIHRAGGNVGNKGSECAEAALRMADLLRQLEKSGAQNNVTAHNEAPRPRASSPPKLHTSTPTPNSDN
jgi:6,7-dimethyl-8-ribityllumazine synthase